MYSNANSVHCPDAHVAPTTKGEKPARPKAADRISVLPGSQNKIGPQNATAYSVATSSIKFPDSVALAEADDCVSAIFEPRSD